MATEARRGGRDYLKLRGGTYWLRFQYPPALRESAKDLYGLDEWPSEKALSLRTKDETEARAAARDLVGRHLDLLLYHRARNAEEHWADLDHAWLMEPNTHQRLPDGTTVIATQTVITRLSPDGVVTSEANRPRPIITYTDLALRSPEGRAAVRHHEERQEALHPDVDAAVIDAYATRLQKDDAALVRRGLHRFKEVNGGRAIADSTRADVGKLIDAEMAARGPQGVERVKKMVRYLSAAVNHSLLDEVKSPYTRNIFSKPDLPEHEPKRRPGYTPADIKALREKLHLLDDEQRLMVTWHVASSVRPVGIHDLRRDEWVEEEEYDEQGNVVRTRRTRCVDLTEKKGRGYGRRRLPIPQAVLDLRRADGTPLLPDQITGALFPTPLDKLLKAINQRLRTFGINTSSLIEDADTLPGKSLYSARHRARDRMKQARVPDEASRAIMGHRRSRSDSHGHYGHG